MTLSLRHRRPRLALGVISATVLFTAGCGGGGGGGNPPSGEGSELFTVGLTAELGALESLNPWATNLVGGQLARTMTYPLLVQLNDNLVEPAWATSWEASEEGRVYTFELAEAEWSDGEPMTAEDAAWTGEQILKYANGAAGLVAYALQGVESMEAVDDTTLRVTYTQPVPETTLSLLTAFNVLPEHVYSEHAEDGRALKTFKPEDDLPMVSGGPFIATSFDPEGTTVFERNESWYGEEPSVETVGIQVFQNDEAMAQSLSNGDLSIAYAAGSKVAASVEGDDGLEVREEESASVDLLNINSSGNNPDHPELQDPVVREALSLAIDRNELIEVELDGFGEPGRSLLPPIQNAWIPEDLQADPFDPDAANQMLDDLGYTVGADGIRAADGRRMSYELVVWAELDRIAQILTRNFAEIGVELEPVIAPDYDAAVFGPDGDYGTLDMVFSTWTVDIEPNSILDIYTCAAIGVLNFAGWCNESYDEMVHGQQGALDDEQRAEILGQIQELLLRTDRVALPLYHAATVHVVAEAWAGTDTDRVGPGFWTGATSGG